MKTIEMGLNTEPDFLKADKMIDKWENSTETEETRNKMIEYWVKAGKRSLELKKQIEQVMREDGECRLSWSCDGRTRHMMHSEQWKKALESNGWNWEIGYNYECVIRR